MGKQMRAIFAGEWRYWSRQPGMYAYAVVLGLLSAGMMAGTAGIFEETPPAVLRVANSPITLYGMMMLLNKLTLFLLPATVGHAVYRDFRSNIYNILYTYPFTKRDYLFGKFGSAFLVVCLISLAVPLGLALGTRLPGIPPAALLPFDLQIYGSLFLIYFIPNVLAFSALVFAFVLLTRNGHVGFIAILLCLIVREILIRLTAGPEGSWGAMLLEPFGESATFYYLPTGQDNPEMPLGPALIWNRIFILTFAVAVFGLAYRWFSFSQPAAFYGIARFIPARFLKTGRLAKSGAIKKNAPGVLPLANSQATFWCQCQAAWALSGLEFRLIVKSGSFISVLLAGSVLTVVLLLQSNPPHGARLLPVTQVMLSFPVFFFSLLIQFMTFLYAGVLVNRARAARMYELVDTTPAPNWVLLGARFLALVKMQIVLLCIVLVAGVSVQAYNGIYQFHIRHYLFDLYGIHLAGLVIWAFAAIFIQNLLVNPYLGMFLLILGIFGSGELSKLGIESPVFRFNQDAVPGFYLKYSDWIGHGHPIISYFIYKAYWALFGLGLFLGALLLYPRGADISFLNRIRTAKERFGGITARAFLLVMFLFVMMGYWLYREEKRPCNERPNSQREQAILQAFQQQYSGYGRVTQPRITAVYLTLNLFPESGTFEASGKYTLVNQSNRVMDTLLVRTGYDEISTYHFDRVSTLIGADEPLKFTAFRVAQGLAPGDSLFLYFEVKNKANTWLVQNSNVLSDGTFLWTDAFPSLVYPSDATPAHPADPSSWQNHYQSKDSDLVDFEIIVGTSADQTALAPGILQATWMAQGRRYFHYKTDQKIKSRLAINSGRYQLMRDHHRGIELKIYHHPAHGQALTSMMHGLKASLDYHARFFGPYRYASAQIVEFPLSAGTFSTAYGNCIPISEVRFLADNRQAPQQDIDLAFYVAAHELAHHWWGNQILPADALGALMLTESVAEYVSAKIYEQAFGKAKAEQFLRIQWKRYQQGRANADKKEVPLAYVGSDQSYLAYGKGALAFYTLSERIGEERLNGALKAYLEKNQGQQPPYPTSIGLLREIRLSTPDSLQYLVTDLFERVESQHLERFE